MLLETNTKFQKFVINECIDFRLACNNYGIKLNASKSGVCFCPFHYNKNTPSAKCYKSGLYCFSENRSFSVTDLFEYELADDYILNVFNNVWLLLDVNQKEELIKIFNKREDGSFYCSIEKNFLPLLDYKRNKIGYTEYCDRLLNILKQNREQ